MVEPATVSSRDGLPLSLSKTLLTNSLGAHDSVFTAYKIEMTITVSVLQNLVRGEGQAELRTSSTALQVKDECSREVEIDDHSEAKEHLVPKEWHVGHHLSPPSLSDNGGLTTVSNKQGSQPQ